MIEHDPTGRRPNEPGAKLDAGKVRMGLVFNGFAAALCEVAKVGTYGANKYTDNGWREVPNGIERYTDALHRHLNAEAQGEGCDCDTGLLHAAHTAWNALARLELLLRSEAKAPATATIAGDSVSAMLDALDALNTRARANEAHASRQGYS